jgi:hypothetical protein
MVAVLEAGQKLEDHFTKEELESPADADPKHDELWNGYQRYLKTGSMQDLVRHGCNWCGQPPPGRLVPSITVIGTTVPRGPTRSFRPRRSPCHRRSTQIPTSANST